MTILIKKRNEFAEEFLSFLFKCDVIGVSGSRMNVSGAKKLNKLCLLAHRV